MLCDRFADSTLVYQGVGKGIDPEYVHMLHNLTLGNFTPDLTIILDIDPGEGLKRAHARQDGETRFELLGLDFHHAVRAGFLNIATREPERCTVIDATQSKDALHAQIRAVVAARLGLAL